jgi:hypothetical protein
LFCYNTPAYGGEGRLWKSAITAIPKAVITVAAALLPEIRRLLAAHKTV